MREEAGGWARHDHEYVDKHFDRFYALDPRRSRYGPEGWVVNQGLVTVTDYPDGTILGESFSTVREQGE